MEMTRKWRPIIRWFASETTPAATSPIAARKITPVWALQQGPPFKAPNLSCHPVSASVHPGLKSSRMESHRAHSRQRLRPEVTPLENLLIEVKCEDAPIGQILGIVKMQLTDQETLLVSAGTRQNSLSMMGGTIQAVDHSTSASQFNDIRSIYQELVQHDIQISICGVGLVDFTKADGKPRRRRHLYTVDAGSAP
jgi:hypothetical protein